MLLQTNSYVVPRDKRPEHARLVRRIRQLMLKLGCESFEVYEQVGANWNPLRTNDRFIQLMRFRDRGQHQNIQAAERNDPAAQQLIREFCDLVELPYQQEQSLFAIGFYASITQGWEGSHFAPDPAEASPADGGPAETGSESSNKP